MIEGAGGQSGTGWHDWREAVTGTPLFDELAARLGAGARTELAGLPGSLAQVLVAALLATRPARGVLALFPDAESAGQAALDLAFLLEPGRVSLLPDGPIAPYEDLSPSPAQVAQRHRGLCHLAELDRRGGIVVAPVAALALKGPGAAERKGREVVLEEGGSFGYEALQERLVRSGYERTELVQDPGDFAVRGGIVDIVPADGSAGIRVEFWGDRIESLREFSLRDQRTTGSLGHIRLPPRPRSHAG
jgi:transcription-repair coupling factor (superfamily II helicase)